MSKTKVLNLYAGIGGNRKLWKNVDVTAIDNEPQITEVYKKYFPNDTIIIDDAVDYLEKHFHEFDFIWASPPCQSHSRINRFNIARRYNGEYNIKVKIPDFRLYSIINFFDKSFRGNWVVENTYSDYKPLKEPQRIGRHFIWSNKQILPYNDKTLCHNIDKHLTLSELYKLYGFNLDNVKFDKLNKKQILRNCVLPELGLHIFNCAYSSL